MENKTRLITPFLMLLAGAVASIIMYIREYEFTRMLWVLLAVLLIFYVLGDVARYLYASVRPRIIPGGDLDKMVMQARKSVDLTGSVVAFGDDGQAQAEAGVDADGLMSDDMEGYSDEELGEYADNGEEPEYTEEYGEGSYEDD